MPLSDDNAFLYQLSVSLPPSEQFAKGDMVNIRGRNPQEFMHNLNAMDQHMTQEAANVVANIRGAWTIIRDAGGQVVERTQHQAPPQNPQTPPQNPAQQPQGYQGHQQQSAPQNGSQGYQQPPPQNQGYQQGGYQQQQPQQPQGDGIPTSPPPHVGPPPECSHGVKNFLAKPYRNGKPGYWMAWACPAQKGDPSQHELDFIQQKR